MSEFLDFEISAPHLTYQEIFLNVELEQSALDRHDDAAAERARARTEALADNLYLGGMSISEHAELCRQSVRQYKAMRN
jgi:hypothetical protein